MGFTKSHEILLYMVLYETDVMYEDACNTEGAAKENDLPNYDLLAVCIMSKFRLHTHCI